MHLKDDRVLNSQSFVVLKNLNRQSETNAKTFLEIKFENAKHFRICKKFRDDELKNFNNKKSARVLITFQHILCI